MRIVYDIVDTRQLTAVIRQFPFGENRLQAFLPNRSVEDIDYRFLTGRRTNRAATVRAFDTPARIGSRPGATERRGTLPSISEMLPLSESERLRLRRLTGTEGDLVRQAIYDDAFTAASAVANRIELLRGEALATGRIVIDENGVQQEIDYGQPADLRVSASTAWSDPAADILGDLLTWIEAFNDHGNDGAGTLLVSQRVLGLMLRNEAIRGLVQTGPNAPAIVSIDALNQTLVAHGLPPVAVYNRRVEDANGNAVRVIPEGTLLMLPDTTDGQGRLGETQLGVPEEAVAAVNARAIPREDAPGLIAVTLQQDHPVLTATLVTSIALPVIDQPERFLSATVL